MAFIVVAANSKGVRWTDDGKTVHQARSLAAVLDTLDTPTAIVCEPAFYDGLRDVRRVMEQWVAERGHQLVPVTRKASAVLEAAAGPNIKGRGLAHVYSIVSEGSAGLISLRGKGQDVWSIRDAADVAHALDLHGAGVTLTNALAVVGPYDSLGPEMRRALGDGVAYDVSVLLAAYRAALVSPDRGTFEAYLGLTAGSHGGMARTIKAWYVARNTTDEFGRGGDLTWTDYRRALRHVYHAVREGQVAAASAGSVAAVQTRVSGARRTGGDQPIR